MERRKSGKCLSAGKRILNLVQYGGWKANQEGSEYERNILVIIPGKNRREAVVMADHYDTAYMGDVFDRSLGGSGARLSAAGADDNYSATATLLLAAPIFLRCQKKESLSGISGCCI